MNKINEAQTEEIRNLMERYDKNKDGYLDKEDLLCFMNDFNEMVQSSGGEIISNAEFENMFSKVDIDNNGKIDLDELAYELFQDTVEEIFPKQEPVNQSKTTEQPRTFPKADQLTEAQLVNTDTDANEKIENQEPKMICEKASLHFKDVLTQWDTLSKDKIKELVTKHVELLQQLETGLDARNNYKVNENVTANAEVAEIKAKIHEIYKAFSDNFKTKFTEITTTERPYQEVANQHVENESTKFSKRKLRLKFEDLKQTRPFEQYLESFHNLANQLEASEEDFLEQFLDGLKESVKNQLTREKNERTLSDAIKNEASICSSEETTHIKSEVQINARHNNFKGKFCSFCKKQNHSEKECIKKKAQEYIEKKAQEYIKKKAQSLVKNYSGSYKHQQTANNNPSQQNLTQPESCQNKLVPS